MAAPPVLVLALVVAVLAASASPAPPDRCTAGWPDASPYDGTEPERLVGAYRVVVLLGPTPSEVASGSLVLRLPPPSEPLPEGRVNLLSSPVVGELSRVLDFDAQLPGAIADIASLDSTGRWAAYMDSLAVHSDSVRAAYRGDTLPVLLQTWSGKLAIDYTPSLDGPGHSALVVERLGPDGFGGTYVHPSLLEGTHEYPFCAFRER